MPTLARIHVSNVSDKTIEEFKEFCKVNLRLEDATVPTNVQTVKRFLKHAKYVVNGQSIASYLKLYLDKAPKTYNRQITVLRQFVGDFLRHPELMSSFKMAPVDEIGSVDELPTNKQVRIGFDAQLSIEAKTIYLFTATTGLRKSEVLKLLKENVNTTLRSVIPKHFTRKKRSGITFYNEETEEWLKKYLNERKDNDPRMFVISDRKWRGIWRCASQNAKTRITPKTLRVWFATETGERGVPDRYVDIFQGRAPRSVLAKHYTGKELQRLKRIYDKASLKVLN